MIFIDGAILPPAIQAAEMENFFDAAQCSMHEEGCSYHRVILAGGKNWSGNTTLCHYHIEDPIIFNRSIGVTIEHGHNNQRSDEYSSSAHWYRMEPHKEFPPLPDVSMEYT